MTLHHLMHAAADEIHAERLTADDAPGYIASTVLAAFTPPGRKVPQV